MKIEVVIYLINEVMEGSETLILTGVKSLGYHYSRRWGSPVRVKESLLLVSVYPPVRVMINLVVFSRTRGPVLLPRRRVRDSYVLGRHGE